jgi:hypothetical protein
VDPQAYLPVAQRAHRLATSLWGKRKAAPGFVVFLADDQQFSKWFGNADSPELVGGITVFPQIAADADGRRGPRRDPARKLDEATKPVCSDLTAGARIVLRMSTIATMQRAETVMAHEMAHAIGPHIVANLQTDPTPETVGMDQPSWVVEGFARWNDHMTQPGSADRAAALVRRNMAKYRPTDGIFPKNTGFYSDDPGRTSFNYEIGAAFFYAAEKTANRQKATDLYIALSSSPELTSLDRGFIDDDLRAARIDPDRFWATYKKLVA